MTERQRKLKEKLERHLNRKATKIELINAEKDMNLINEVLEDEVEDLKIRVKKLENV